MQGGWLVGGGIKRCRVGGWLGEALNDAGWVVGGDIKQLFQDKFFTHVQSF